MLQITSLIILSLLPIAFAQNAASTDDDSIRIKRDGFSAFGPIIQVSANLLKMLNDADFNQLQNLQKSAFSASASLSSGSSSSSTGAVTSLSSGSSSSGGGHSSGGHSDGGYGAAEGGSYGYGPEHHEEEQQHVNTV